MEGRELTARERGKLGPADQADSEVVAWPRLRQRACAYQAQVHGLVVENMVSFWN